MRCRHTMRPCPPIVGCHPEPPVRSLTTIQDAEDEFFEKVWYMRTVILEAMIERGLREPSTPVLEEQIHAKMRGIEARYGEGNVKISDPWEWGYVNGKLSALRWMLGYDWDMLDT